MAFLFFGIALGCFMFAFVNSRYNEKRWIKSRYILGMGIVSIILGLVMLL